MPPQNFLATIGCPSCGTRFQTPVEQVLDVRVDPSAKNRALTGSINVATCPSCGMGGSLNLPFIYHDPDKGLALLYLPVNSGETEEARQKVAGKLTRQLMDSMAVEERKGYLLQPETFINLDTFVKRALELEGVTEDDMQRGQKQREFLNELMSAEEESWAQLVADNEDLLDDSFFGMLEYTMQMISMQAGGDSDGFKKAEAAYQYVIENSKIGQLLMLRTQVMETFTSDPTQESLLKALIAAPDAETLSVLVHNGLSFLDYTFFQNLVKRMEDSTDAHEKEALVELRRKILEVRDEIAHAGQEIAKARAQLLQNLLKTEDALKMARSHRSELDDAFSFVLRAEIEDAQKREDKDALEVLQGLAGMVNQVLEEAMPPEVVLVRRLMLAPSDEVAMQLLQTNTEMLTPPFFEFLNNLVSSSGDMGDAQSAARLQHIQELARNFAQQADAATTAAPLSSGETTTPSGLIIAKH